MTFHCYFLRRGYRVGSHDVFVILCIKCVLCGLFMLFYVNVMRFTILTPIFLFACIHLCCDLNI